MPGMVVRGRCSRRRRGRPRTWGENHEDQVHRTVTPRHSRSSHPPRSCRPQRRPTSWRTGAPRAPSRPRSAASPSTCRATSTSRTPRRPASTSSPATARRCAPGAAPATAPACSRASPASRSAPTATSTRPTPRPCSASGATARSRRAGAAGAPSPGKLRYAAGIAVAPDGTVYVVDRWNRRVQAFTADGEFLRVVARHADGDDDEHEHDHDHGLDLDDPRGIAAAADGTIFVAENEEEFVAHLSPDRHGPEDLARPGRRRRRGRPRRLGPRDRRATTTSCAGPRPTARRSATLGTGFAPEPVPGEALIEPAAVATDCRGAVYVTDRSVKRVHVYGDAGLLAPPCVDEPTPPPPPAAAVDPGPEPQTQVAGITEASPEPTLGSSGVGEPVSGQVLVQQPGDTELHRAAPALQAAGRHDRRRHRRRRPRDLRRPRPRTSRPTARRRRRSSGAASSASSRPPAARSSTSSSRATSPTA